MALSSRGSCRRHVGILFLIFILLLLLIWQGRELSTRFEIMTLSYSNDDSQQYTQNASTTTIHQQPSQKNSTSLPRTTVNASSHVTKDQFQLFNYSLNISTSITNRNSSKQFASSRYFQNSTISVTTEQSKKLRSTSSKSIKMETLHATDISPPPSIGSEYTSEEPEQQQQQRHSPISIVVQLSGEMGNNMHKIAMGRAIQRLAKDRYDIETNIILQRQERGSKWISARNDIQQCFPNLRHYDFELGNGLEFTKRIQQQQEWLGQDGSQKLVLQDRSNNNNQISHDIDHALKFLHQILTTNETSSSSHQQRPFIKEENDRNSNITLPFLYSQAFVNFQFMDHYYTDFKQLFAFDEMACCSKTITPDFDESVFHFRNYIAEMPRKGKQKGFEELSPIKTSNELFGHLHPGDKVAITTRVYNNETQRYVHALEDHLNLTVRVISGNSGIQDFCFLTQTQKELAGISRSTFLQWAAILGMTRTAWLYSIDSPQTRDVLGDPAMGEFYNFNWTNKVLREKIRTVIFQSEEMEDALQMGQEVKNQESMTYQSRLGTS